MDIINLEREKGITRCMIKSIPLRIAGLDSTSCYNYLISHPNKEIVGLIDVVCKATDEITNKWQCQVINNMINIGLTICCRDEKYSKVLSKVLSDIYGYDVKIEKYKSFNIVEKTMFKALMNVSNRMLKDRTYALDMVHDLLSDCGNDAISFIHAVTSDAMQDELSEKEYNRSIQFFEFLLYVLYLDTAYRDPFFWILNKISRKEIQDVIAKHVVEPYNWYVNVWMRSKALTKQQQVDGKIPPYAHSIVERRMCPAKQAYDLNKKNKR